MALTRDQILTADDGRFTEVDVPEWGGSVRIKTLSAGGLIQLMKLTNDGDDLSKLEPGTLADIVIMTAVDTEGKYLFTSDDRKMLTERNGVVMVNLATKAIAANKFSGEPEKN